jgi:heat shock protein HslJ
MRLPTLLASLCLILLMNPAAAQTAATLPGSKWTVTEALSAPIIAGSTVTLTFPADGTVAGNTGVNNFNGFATVSGSNVKFEKLRSTRRAGSPQLMEQEARFNRALAATAQFQIAPDGGLTLKDPDGVIVLRAQPARGE